MSDHDLEELEAFMFYAFEFHRLTAGLKYEICLTCYRYVNIKYQRAKNKEIFIK